MNRMMRALSAEFRKVRATKTWWILAIVLALYAAMMSATFAFLFSAIADELAAASVSGGSVPAAPAPSAAADADTANMVYSAATTFGYVVPLVLGALIATGELRHRTLGLTFAIEPKRGIVLAGKTVMLLVVGAVLGAFGVVGAVGAGAPILAATDHPTMLTDGSTWLLFARIIVALAIWAVIGFGVGLLVRNQVFAVVLALVFTQFLEPVLRAGAQFWEWSAQIAKYLPGSATDAFVGASVMNDLSATDPTLPASAAPLSIGVGFAVFTAYAVVTVLAGWWLRWRTDVTPEG